MARYQAEIAKLIIYNSQKSKTFVGCFVTQPKLEEERLGQIFIVAEIKKRNVAGLSALDCQKFIDILAASIRNNYYGKGKNNEFGGESIELLFEAALQKTNRDLQSYLLQKDRRGVENFLDNVNIIMGVCLRHQIHFAGIGDMESFLVRKNRLSDVLAASQKTKERQKSENINPAKIFSHLISGNLEADDGLIFATPSILDYFSQEKIKRIIKDNPANKAIQMINSLLSEIDEKAAVAAVLIKLTSGTGIGAKSDLGLKSYFKPSAGVRIFRRPEKKNVEDSIAELLNRREETNKIISSTVSGFFKKMLPNFLKRGSRATGKDLNYCLGKTVDSYRKAELTERRLQRPFSREVDKRGKIKFDWLGQMLGKIATLFRRRKGIQLKKKIKGQRKLGLGSKAILVICVIFGILFIQSLFTLSKKQGREHKETLFSKEVERIREETERASSRLILGDEGSAMDIYENVLEAIKVLPQDSEKQQAQALALKERIESKIRELNKIKEVSLDLLLDLGGFSFFAQEKPEQILKMGEKIFIISESAKIYEYDLASGEIKKRNESNLGTEGGLNVKRYNDNNLIIKKGSLWALFNLEKGEILPLAIAGRADLIITDFEIYNDNLYILDADKNLILRYSRAGNSFIRETAWLKDETDFYGAREMAIDGSIWVLWTNGEIKNLMRGKLQDLTFLDGPGLARLQLIGPSRIWTESAANNVYFMDGGSKRIVAMDKAGKIKQQYLADFIDLKGFVADEASGKIYVLDDKIIYSFGMK